MKKEVISSQFLRKGDKTMSPFSMVLTTLGIAIVVLALLHLKKQYFAKKATYGKIKITKDVSSANANSPSFLMSVTEDSETALMWDTADVGEILIITFPGSFKRRAIAKAEVSHEDYQTIIQSHVERYDRNDESHKGVVAQQWKTIATKIRNNPDLLNNMDASYMAILQEVAMWTPFEKLRLKESVVQDVPKRPGETLPTEFFERLFDVPKVSKATTTSIHLAKE